MGYFARKSLTGYKEVSFEDAEVYIETIDEYNQNIVKMKNFELAIDQVKKDADHREIIAYNKAEQEFRAYRDRMNVAMNRKLSAALAAEERAEEKVSLLNEEKDRLEDSLQKQFELNDNLKRIARERANAKRGLQPKKENSGYLVLWSIQCKQRYDKTDVADVWHSFLQTPYDSSISLDLVIDDIMEDLLNRVLYAIGIGCMQKKENNGVYKSRKKEDENGVVQEISVLYKWDFKANYISGFWEMDLYHTKALCVPEDYRPVRK